MDSGYNIVYSHDAGYHCDSYKISPMIVLFTTMQKGLFL